MAGLRVLPEDNRNPFNRSREEQLVLDHPKKPSYLGIYGGKLTGYRANAEKILHIIHRNLGKKTAIAKTSSIRLKFPV